MQRLYRRYPTARFYLIMDDDVFINRHLLTQFIANRDPHELALYGPGYCDWGVKRELKEKISMTLNMQMPDFIHIVIGGIMLFTAAAVKRFTDSTLLMQCIDDLETLYGNQIFLWGGLKQSALYNQDWLFCWCLQVRMNGRVVFDKAFEDVEFPARKCTTLADSARYRVGIHHTNPRRIRALWRVYHRWAPAREANRSLKAWRDPAEPVRCAIDSNGDPRERHSWSEHRYLDTFKRPVSTRECKSIVQSKEMQRRFPHCISHMAYVRKHADTSPCWGGMGRRKCEGFQLDANDYCNLQYYLFCERLYKGASTVWCPSPEGYPKHCCYSSGLAELAGAKKTIEPARYLLGERVYPL